jgi:hypothetical protein
MDCRGDELPGGEQANVAAEEKWKCDADGAVTGRVKI